MKKICFKCKLKKPLSDFYQHPGMKDGRLGKCKNCTLADVSEYRSRNLEQIQAYDRKRKDNDQHRAAVRKNYRKRIATAKGRALERKRNREWQERNRIKRAAHIITGNAIARGILKKHPCERCGSKSEIQAHHEDYSLPFNVTWLCVECHGRRHREINEEKRKNS